jgi:hypothetical protein
MFWKVFLGYALPRLRAWLESITPQQQSEAVDFINKKIGGDRRIEAASLRIIIQAVDALLAFIKLQ